MKLKFEEAISVPESARHSVADSIDYHAIGMQFFFTAFKYILLDCFGRKCIRILVISYLWFYLLLSYDSY